MNEEAVANEDLFASLLDKFDAAYRSSGTLDFWKNHECSADMRLRVEQAHDGLRKLDSFLSRPNANSDATTRETTPEDQLSMLSGMLTRPMQIDRFQIIGEIGRGGFGIVYIALDPMLNRRVAIKIPRIETLETQSLRNRFAKEAEISASLDHPHIVPVYEIGQTSQGIYIVSLYCPGTNLAQWLMEHRDELTLQQLVDLMVCIAEPIAYCHDQGILHRDIKPGNVLLFPSAYRSLPFLPRVSDFGLAKVLESNLRETVTNAVLGTPLYMAPEQVSSKHGQVGPATDVYALGAVLYELLTGRPPFAAGNLVETLDEVRKTRPTAPRKLNPNIPSALETICLKCLSKNPADRYPAAGDLLKDLQAFTNGENISARRPTLLRSLANALRVDDARSQSLALKVATIISASLITFFILLLTFKSLSPFARDWLNTNSTASESTLNQAQPSQTGATFGDGSDVYVAAISLSELQSFTLEMRIKPKLVRGMICNLDGMLQVEANDHSDLGPTIGIPISEDEFLLFSSLTPLIRDQWNHFAVTYDGDSIDCYVNGSKTEYDVYHYDSVDSKQITEEPSPIKLGKFWGDLGLSMGGNTPTSSKAKHYPFDGTLGEIAFTRGVVYTDSFKPQQTITTNADCICHYRFKPEKPSTVEDLCGKSPPATLFPYK